MQQGQDDELTLLVPAELDLATSQQLAHVLAEACASQAPRVVVDLSHVTFCDVVALRVLLDAADRATARDCTLSLHGPPAMLQRMAQLLGLSSRLGLPEDQPDPAEPPHTAPSRPNCDGSATSE